MLNIWKQLEVIYQYGFHVAHIEQHVSGGNNCMFVLEVVSSRILNVITIV